MAAAPDDLTTATENPDVRRLRTGRDWSGYLTLDNYEAVAARLRALLTGRRFTTVMSNQGHWNYRPEVRTGERLSTRGVTTHLLGDNDHYGYITFSDGNFAWGLSGHPADQAAARRLRTEAWEAASEEDRASGAWEDQSMVHLSFKQERLEVEHFAPIGYRLYWIFAAEPVGEDD